MTRPVLLPIAILTLCLVTFTARGQDSLFDIDIGSYPGEGLNSRANPGIASGSHSGLYIRMAEDVASFRARPPRD